MIFFNIFSLHKIDTNNQGDITNNSNINEDQNIRRVGAYDSKKICLEYRS